MSICWCRMAGRPSRDEGQQIGTSRTLDLIPKPLIVARYFAKEQAAIEKLRPSSTPSPARWRNSRRSTAARRGCSSSAKTDKGKLTKVSVKPASRRSCATRSRRRTQPLQAYLSIIEKEAAHKRVEGRRRGARARLREVSQAHPGRDQDPGDGRQVAARLAADVQSELDRVSQALTGRIRQLAERYATPLPKLADEVETLAARVEEHLKRMGASWNVRPGYKQTEVGVIPEEWDGQELATDCEVTSGHTPVGPEYRHPGANGPWPYPSS